MVAILFSLIIDVIFKPFNSEGLMIMSNGDCHFSCVVIKQTVTSSSEFIKTIADDSYYLLDL